MFKSIPGNDHLLISLEGRFKSKIATMTDRGCTPEIVDGKVALDIYGEFVTVDVEWLAMMAHYEVFLPESLRDRDQDIYFQNGQMRIKRPIEVFEGFRLVPGFPRYGVSREGFVRDIYSHEPVNIMERTRLGDVDYLRIRIYDPKVGRKCEKVLHRLVALAWVKNPDPINKIYVNHKDGNKANTHFTNLEWVTSGENNIHAVEYSLRSDNQPCEIRNVQTGEVVRFRSYSEAAQRLGSNASALISYMKRIRKTKLFLNLYEIRLLETSNEWLHADCIKKAGRYVTTVTSNDGSVETFYDTRDLVRRYRLWNLPSNSLKEIISRMADVYPDLRVTVVDQYDNREIQALRISDRVVLEASTIREMSRLTSVDHRIINSRIKKKKLVQTNGYVFRYKADESWPDTIPELQSRSMCISAVYGQTGEILKFESLRSAARHFGVDRHLIKARLRTNKDHQGWTFQESNTSI